MTYLFIICANWSNILFVKYVPRSQAKVKQIVNNNNENNNISSNMRQTSNRYCPSNLDYSKRLPVISVAPKNTTFIRNIAII